MPTYLIVTEKAGRNYSAYAPDLPGCVATGKTREDAEANMFEAIELHLRGLQEDGLEIPVPSASFKLFRWSASRSRSRGALAGGRIAPRGRTARSRHEVETSRRPSTR